MDKETYLDEIVEYPAKILEILSQDKNCISLLLNKKISEVNKDDEDEVLDKYLYNYEYVDNTITESLAYICSEIDIPSVSNEKIKSIKIYITISCHKGYMKLDEKILPGIVGNRRDNIARYIDKKLNGNDLFGIGKLQLVSSNILSSSNSAFTVRELVYRVPDFNVKAW